MKPIFKVETKDGKPTLMEAKLIKKSGSWWHIAGSNGKTVKMNGGGGWSETITEAWSREISLAYVIAELVKAGTFEGDWYEEFRKANKTVIAALEDMYSWGELQGEIKATTRKRPQGGEG